MVHRLSAIASAIGDDAIAVGEALLFRDVANHQPEMRNKFCVCIVDRRYGRNWLLRNNKYVRGSLRGDVVKRQALIVFIHDLGWDLFIDDALEDGRFVHGLLAKLIERDGIVSQEDWYVVDNWVEVFAIFANKTGMNGLFNDLPATARNLPVPNCVVDALHHFARRER